jgi:Tol biopolymer transport system component
MPGVEISRAKQLTGGFGKHEGNYSLNWLPNGKIIYGTVMTGKGEDWTIDADGRNAKLVSPDAGSDGVSPDGKYLVFQSGDGEGSGLFRLNTDNEERKRLTKGTDVWASVSPDGKWVVFTRYGNQVALWKVPLGGGEAVKLTNIAGFPLAPSVSPDGKLIAFFGVKTERRPKLHSSRSRAARL